VDKVYHYALRTLARRDYSERQLRARLVGKFGEAPDAVLALLKARRFLDDRRYADNFADRHADRHPAWVRAALEEAGVSAAIVDQTVRQRDWPSLRNVLDARIAGLGLRPPLKRKDAARLFRALGRLGYPEEEIREELERFHEQ
jgi:SOS response regulatory protein OraA/RecX